MTWKTRMIPTHAEWEPKPGDIVEIVSVTDSGGVTWSAELGAVGVIDDYKSYKNGVYLLDNNRWQTNFTKNMLRLVTQGSL